MYVCIYIYICIICIYTHILVFHNIQKFAKGLTLLSPTDPCGFSIQVPEAVRVFEDAEVGR